MTHGRGRNIPETPFGARLRAARKMAGLSMEDLAAKLDGMVTKQAISKYEQGRMLPSPEVLERLVEVLRDATRGASPLRPENGARDARDIVSRFSSATVPDAHDGADRGGFCVHLVKDVPDVGSRPHEEKIKEVEPALRSQGFSPLAARRAHLVRDWGGAGAGLDRIRFRAGERLSAKTESALRYRIADHLHKCLEIESVLGMRAAFENPIAGRPVNAREDVEGAAAEVRRRWELGSGPIVNLLGLLEDKGIRVYETRGIEGFEGLSGRFGDVPFVAVSMERPADRIRFTAAHELGHMLCDFDAAENPEGECHAFGAAFLLPRAALEEAFRPARRKVTLGDLAEIKEAYGLSLQAIMYRAHGLGLASDRQLRSFRETVRARGWTVTEPVTYAGRERATRFRRLLRYAVAAEIIDAGRAAEMAGAAAEEIEREIGQIF